jgi:hypothetical protein
MNKFFQTLTLPIIRTKNLILRTVSIFAAPITLVLVGATLQICAAAIDVAEKIPADQEPGLTEFTKQTLTVAKQRLLGS